MQLCPHLHRCHRWLQSFLSEHPLPETIMKLTGWNQILRQSSFQLEFALLHGLEVLLIVVHRHRILQHQCPPAIVKNNVGFKYDTSGALIGIKTVHKLFHEWTPSIDKHIYLLHVLNSHSGTSMERKKHLHVFNSCSHTSVERKKHWWFAVHSFPKFFFNMDVLENL